MRLLHANGERGVHAPSWYAATCELPTHAALERDVEADVCIVGGGYTGLATAGALARRGHSVVLLEAHRLGWGASGRNGGQLGSGFNVGQDELAKRLGSTRAHALWQLAEEARASIRALDGRHGIDLEYRPGVIHAMHRARDVPRRHEYAAHLAREYGYDALEPLDRTALRALVDSDGYHGGTLDHGAAHLHPLRLAAALAHEAEAAGARLHERSEVLRIEGITPEPLAPATASSDVGPSSTAARAGSATGALGTDGALCIVTATGRVRAEQVVLACNGYRDALADPLTPGLAARVMPINNFIIVTEPLGARAERLLPGNHAVADSRFVVNYFRRTPDGRLLFGGGESYGYRFPTDMARRTRRAMLGVFPQLADTRIEFAWGGTLAITPSRLPCVARLAPRLLTAGGYSGHGVGLAVAAGHAIAAALDGDGTRLALLSALPCGRFPGGPRARPALLAFAMRGASWLDRL